MTRREFINAETEAFIAFESGDGPIEADYGNGMHHTDAQRHACPTVAIGREYICEACRYRTGSPADLWDHLAHEAAQLPLFEASA